MEREQSPEAPRFQSPRDEALHAMWDGLWTDASDGDLESPTNRFARVSNSEAELADVVDAFEEKFREIGVDPRTLVGHFILGHSKEFGPVVISFDEEEDMLAAYKELVKVHRAWKRMHP